MRAIWVYFLFLVSIVLINKFSFNYEYILIASFVFILYVIYTKRQTINNIFVSIKDAIKTRPFK